MPLRDHFRSPVNDKHHWSELHGGWPMEIVRQLFDLLPQGYQAGPKVYLGSPFEVDISAFELDSHEPGAGWGNGAGGTTTMTARSPTLTVEADLSEQDQYEVLIYDAGRGRELVAAIEIVSPSNKDRPDSRDAFVGKVASLLQKDVCVSIVDLVSVRQANLYVDLLEFFGRTDPKLAPTPPAMYAVTLRSRKRPKRKTLVDAWFYPMAVGDTLPTLPIWLSPDLSISLPLEPGYRETCRLLHIA